MPSGNDAFDQVGFELDLYGVTVPPGVIRESEVQHLCGVLDGDDERIDQMRAERYD